MRNLVKEYVRALKLRDEVNDDLEYLKKQLDNARIITCTSLENMESMIQRELART